VRYEILGPLRIVDENDISIIKARKIELLLAVLLIRCDQVVSFDQIVAEIWGADMPRRAAATIHVYVSQLRKFLKRPGRKESPIITCAPGYELHLGSDDFDVHDFERLVSGGRALAQEQRHSEAAAAFDAALDLWRGPALGDLGNGVIVNGFAAWLEEARLECTEMMVDAHLAAGQHREIVGFLQALTTEHPLREAFYERLMLALYRSDCQAEALRVYRSARKSINDELGIEPCRTLQELQGAILAGDDHLAGTPADHRTSRSPRTLHLPCINGNALRMLRPQLQPTESG
jgi:SARP family transcriptional regulator, regulator of embCAB operon